MTDNPTLFDLSQYATKAQIADYQEEDIYDPYWQTLDRVESRGELGTGDGRENEEELEIGGQGENPKSKIQNPKSKIQNPKSKIQNPICFSVGDRDRHKDSFGTVKDQDDEGVTVAWDVGKIHHSSFSLHHSSFSIEPIRAFNVGDTVRGPFGTGKIRHIHGKKATVLDGGGRKFQIKICHLQHVEQGRQESAAPVLTVELPVETSPSLTQRTPTQHTDAGEAEEAVLTVSRPAKSAVTQRTPAQKPVLTVKRKEAVTQRTPVDDSVLTVDSLVEESVTVSTRRKRGDGTGRIQWRTIKKNGREYKQPWYDWQIHQGEKTIYKSKYIPKRLLAKIQEMEEQKAPVREILKLLGRKDD